MPNKYFSNCNNKSPLFDLYSLAIGSCNVHRETMSFGIWMMMMHGSKSLSTSRNVRRKAPLTKILFLSVSDAQLTEVKKTIDILLNSHAIKRIPLLHLTKEFFGFFCKGYYKTVVKVSFIPIKYIPPYPMMEQVITKVLYKLHFSKLCIQCHSCALDCDNFLSY